MDCKSADVLMMKYMDNELSEKEAQLLNEHISSCETCRESFYVYDGICADMESLPEFVAPVGFEDAVMLKINKLSEQEIVRISPFDSVKGFLLGSLGVSLGVGAMLVIYREQIITSMLQSEFMAPFATKLLPLSEYVTAQAINIKTGIDSMLISINSFVNQWVWIAVALTALVCSVQFFSIKRRKNLNNSTKADDR